MGSCPYTRYRPSQAIVGAVAKIDPIIEVISKVAAQTNLLALKIDQSFVRDLETPNGSAIVRAIAQLGEALGMAIVAEGVETANQFVMLQTQRCTEAQGYFIAHPQLATNLPQLLAGLQAAVA